VNFLGPLRVTDALAPFLEDDANVVNVTSGIGELSKVTPRVRQVLADTALDRTKLLALVDDCLRAADAKKLEGFPMDGYAFSKAALNALTRVLAKEHAGWRVNSACPGWVRTDMGGKNAPRTVEEGAASVSWAATLPPDGPTGGVYRDGRKIAF